MFKDYNLNHHYKTKNAEKYKNDYLAPHDLPTDFEDLVDLATPRIDTRLQERERERRRGRRSSTPQGAPWAPREHYHSARSLLLRRLEHHLHHQRSSWEEPSWTRKNIFVGSKKEPVSIVGRPVIASMTQRAGSPGLRRALWSSLVAWGKGVKRQGRSRWGSSSHYRCHIVLGHTSRWTSGLPLSKGNTTVLTVVDQFSKMTHFIPLPKLPTAKQTAQVMINQVFCIHGLPTDIVSDRGPQFVSVFWKEFCHLLGATVSLSSGNHPESNGQAECLNQELETCLRCLVSQNQTTWSDYLTWIGYAHTRSPPRPPDSPLSTSSTGISPLSFRSMRRRSPSHLLMPWPGDAEKPGHGWLLSRCCFGGRTT
ncbi:hypothetical protein L3Q82_014680 [Scortum barcoo]|uniref:Uncharacterized protein n=1 Tax=Scortum barcoo TaxID=214431 RepID=A0ACB8VSA2_9TELE|nr:hypothetical protein L3Q82_014680 [Scortum barcoo]